MLPAGDQSEVELSIAPEDGRNYRPKHVELIEIVNKIFNVASSWLFILTNQGLFTLTALRDWFCDGDLGPSFHVGTEFYTSHSEL